MNDENIEGKKSEPQGVFEKLREIALISNLTEEERKAYERSERNRRMQMALLDEIQEKSSEKSMALTTKIIAQNLLREDLPHETIVRVTSLPINDIEAISLSKHKFENKYQDSFTRDNIPELFWCKAFDKLKGIDLSKLTDDEYWKYSEIDFRLRDILCYLNGADETGHGEGEAKAKNNIARNIIAEALPVDMISKVTGLSIDEIKAISLN
jgi:hypothetical protein